MYETDDKIRTHCKDTTSAASVVSIRIPTHCSALLTLQSTAQIKRLPAIYIQCHLDRIVWHVFRPLFLGGKIASNQTAEAACKNHDQAIRALFYLILEFRKRIHSISDHHVPNKTFRDNPVKCKEEEEEEINICLSPRKSKDGKHEQEEKPQPELWEDYEYNLSWNLIANHKGKSIIDHSESKGTTHEDRDFTIRTTHSHLQIYILPPYVLHSPNPYQQSYRPRLGTRMKTLRTEQIFTSALVRQENLHIKLQTLNAYIATHGGGYFLCRFLTTAVRLAQYQRKIALALDDIPLAMKCTINESYNYIHAGKIDHAKRLISAVEEEVEHKLKRLNGSTLSTRSREYKVILGMCQSAAWFAEKVEEAGLKEKNLEGGRQATNDDYFRIRVMTDKNTTVGV